MAHRELVTFPTPREAPCLTIRQDPATCGWACWTLKGFAVPTGDLPHPCVAISCTSQKYVGLRVPLHPLCRDRRNRQHHGSAAISLAGWGAPHSTTHLQVPHLEGPHLLLGIHPPHFDKPRHVTCGHKHRVVTEASTGDRVLVSYKHQGTETAQAKLWKTGAQHQLEKNVSR